MADRLESVMLRRHQPVGNKCSMDEVVLLVVAGATLGGFVQGLSGSNFGLVAMAVWAWSLPPTLVGPLVVCGSLSGQLLAASSLRRNFRPNYLLPMLGGGMLGLPLGVVLLHYIEPVLFQLLVGTLLVVWCPLMLCARELPNIRGGGRLADSSAGLLGGVMGGLGGLTGPAPALWSTLRNWDRDTQRSVIQGFNLVMQALAMCSYFASGLVTQQALNMFPVVIGAVLIPTLLGVRLYRRFSDQAFRRVVLALLTISGLILIVLATIKLL